VKYARISIVSTAFLAGQLLTGCEMSTEIVNSEDPSRILMQEEFTGNANHWFTGAVPGGYDFEITDGEYFLRSLNDSGVVVSKSVPIPEDGDFDIQVSLHLYRTSADLGYGFCWGGDERGDRDCFFISKDRQYSLFQRAGGVVTESVPWTGSSAVDSLRNTLAIRKRGNTLRYSINAKATGALPFARFHGDKLIFAGDGIQDFAVDELIIRTP